MLKSLKKKSNLIFLVLAIVLVVPAFIGVLHQGFPLTDDGNWMVIRFSAFYEALRNGQFPVRFLLRLNNGYGYPVADFLYPLFMYLGAPIHILGFNFVNTVKIILGLSLAASLVFAFLWLRKIFDNVSSLVGSVFYTLFPYHLYDIYKRGSVGEVLSLSIVPFVLWQIERRSLLLTSLGIAFLILAHNTLALLFIPLIFVYIFLRDRRLLKFGAASLVFGFLISSFFWIPALYDSKYTVFGNTSVSDFNNYFVGFGNFNLLGIIFLVALFSSAIFLLLKKEAKNKKLFLYAFVASIIIVFFVFPVSTFVWNFLPVKNLIQFPFRLISLIIVLLAFQVSYIINLAKKNGQLLLAAVFIILIYIGAKPFLFPVDYQYLPDTFYSTNQDTTTVKNEYMPKWVKNIPQTMASSRVQVLNGTGEKVNVLEATPNKTKFNLFLPVARNVQINIVYFPGWNAYVNGVKSNIEYDNPQGLITLKLNKGQNDVLVVFGETPLRVISDLISLLSIIGLPVFYYLSQKKRFKFFKL